MKPHEDPVFVVMVALWVPLAIYAIGVGWLW